MRKKFTPLNDSQRHIIGKQRKSKHSLRTIIDVFKDLAKLTESSEAMLQIALSSIIYNRKIIYFSKKDDMHFGFIKAYIWLKNTS